MKEVTNIKNARQQLNLTQKEFGKAVGIPTRRIDLIEKDYNNATEEERELLCRYFETLYSKLLEENERNTIKEVIPNNRFSSQSELNIHVDEKMESDAQIVSYVSAELKRANEQYKKGTPNIVLYMELAGVEKFTINGVMQTCAVGMYKNAKIYIPESDFFDPYFYEMNPSVHKDLNNRLFSTIPFIPTEIVEKDNDTILVKGDRYMALRVLRLENWIKAKSENKRDFRTGRLLNMIHPGLVTYANVVEVIPKIGVIVEYAGLETLIPKDDMADEFLTEEDIEKMVQTGRSVQIKILNIDIPYTQKGVNHIEKMSYKATMKRTTDKKFDSVFEMTEVGSTYAGKIVRFNKDNKKYLVKLSSGTICLANPTRDDFGLLTKDTRVLVKILGKFVNPTEIGEKKAILAQIKKYYK